eukprot:230819_1
MVGVLVGFPSAHHGKLKIPSLKHFSQHHSSNSSVVSIPPGGFPKAPLFDTQSNTLFQSVGGICARQFGKFTQRRQGSSSLCALAERAVEARRKAGRRKDPKKGFMIAIRFDQMEKWEMPFIQSNEEIMK